MISVFSRRRRLPLAIHRIHRNQRVLGEPLVHNEALAFREVLHAIQQPLGVVIPFYQNNWRFWSKRLHVLQKIRPFATEGWDEGESDLAEAAWQWMENARPQKDGKAVMPYLAGVVTPQIWEHFGDKKV